MKNRFTPLAVAAAHLVLTGQSPGEDGLPVADLQRDTPVDFSKEVVPFLRKNCFACHNEKKAKADLNLESPQAMIKGGDGGPALVPGEPMESLVFTYAAHLEFDPMPPAKNKSNAQDLNPEELALLKLWIEQGAEGTSASVLAGPSEWQPLDDFHAIYSVTISDDGRYAACGRGSRLYVYDLHAGSLAAELTDPNLSFGTAHRDSVHALAFSAQGILASGGYRTAKIWKRHLAPALPIAHGLPEAATAMVVSPDGQWLAAGDAQGNVTVKKLGESAKAPVDKRHDGPVRSLAFSPDSTTLYSVSDDKSLGRASVSDRTQWHKIPLTSEGTALAVLDKGQHLAVGGADGIVRLVSSAVFDQPSDATNAPAPVECNGHSEKVVSLAPLDAEGAQFASAGEDGSVRVWDLSAKQLRQINHGAPVVSLAVHRETNRIATAGGDGAVRLWDAANGNKLGELIGDPDVLAAKARADRELELAKRLSELRKKQLSEREKQWNELKEKSKTEAAAVATSLKDLHAKEAAAHQKRALAESIAREVTALEAAKDPGLAKAKERAKKATDEANKADNELVTAERALQSATRNRDLAVRDGVKAGERFLATQAASAQADGALATAEESAEAAEARVADAGPGALRSVSFSPDGNTVAVAAETIGVRLWNATTFQALDILQSTPSPTLVTSAPDGRLLAAFPDKSITGWDQSPGTWTLTQQIGDGSSADPFSDRVLALAFHPRGHLLATGSGIPSRSGEIRFWRVRDGSAEGVVEEAHRDTVTGLAFSPDGNRIASSSTDRFVKIHEVETGELLEQLEGHTSHVLDVAWSADGETLASAGADHVAKLWAVESGNQKKSEGGFKKELTSISFLGTGENLVMAGGDKVVKAAGQNLGGIEGFVYDVAASPDGATIVAGGEDGTLRVWQASDRKLLHAFPPPAESSTETAAR